MFLLLTACLITQPLLGEESWPTQEEWQELNTSVEGRLIYNDSPLALDHWYKAAENSGEADSPFAVQEYSWGTESTGWLDAWNSVASPYAVAAKNTQDIVAAVKFAKQRGLKLVIKGTGHDYLGRSTSPLSLMVWTHHMNGVHVHDTFIPQGAPKEYAGIPAVTAEAGARWLEVYPEVTTRHHRYVQGGGCTTVGAAGGFLQGGGFGSFSKKYGTGAGSLLEAEVVLANGEVVIANAYQNPDLFWALKGGGGGTFGIVSKVTLQTHELPKYFGILQGKITATTDEAFHDLLEQFIHFYRENLNTEHWGEQVSISPDNSLELFLLFQDLAPGEAEKIWAPFQTWIAQQSTYKMESKYTYIPAEKFWDYDYLEKNTPDIVLPFQNAGQFDWKNNQEEVLVYWYTMESRWIPLALFEKTEAKKLATTFFDASRHRRFALHFNKGLAGASAEARQRFQETAMNPDALDAAALITFGARTHSVFPGMLDHEPNMSEGRAERDKVEAAMKIIVEATPHSGSYVNETNYFQKDWQKAFWGTNYARLLQIKRKYDPDNFFQCHHCVGSEKETSKPS